MAVRWAVAVTSGWMILALLGSAIAEAQSSPASPTFSKDVAPIFYKNYVTCHRPGEMAPMSLLSYEQARPWARAIAEKIAGGSMPPWHAEAPSGTFLNERRITPIERDTVLKWVKNGALPGDPKDMPPVPKFPAGWTIGSPDAVVSMETEFEVPASGTIPYQ